MEITYGLLAVLALLQIYLIIVLAKQRAQSSANLVGVSLADIQSLERNLREELSRVKSELSTVLVQQSESTQRSFGQLRTSLEDSATKSLSTQMLQFDQFGQRLDKFTETTEQKLSEAEKNSTASRRELSTQLEVFGERHGKLVSELTERMDTRLEKMRSDVELRLEKIRTDNNTKLEQMRETVDEKLQKTLERRLGESFNLVSERLENVQKGLGEMQSLATGVGDLKRVLTNVKSRGTFAEYQLEALLEQVFVPEQYAKNVKTKAGSNALVEFAIKLPDKAEGDGTIWLPIDAKFPMEDYQRLCAAQDLGDMDAVLEAGKALENRIKTQAKDIRDKYIDPPATTDFGLLYLPTEGLYAEVVRREKLFDYLRNECKVCVVGPTTLHMVLNALQMGFRTLAIEKKSSDVWQLLSIIKKEFGLFGSILEKTQKKIQEAGNVIETARKKTTTITRKLNKVQDIPTELALGSPEPHIDLLNTASTEIAELEL